ncbi:MAG: hypothetical protein ACUVWN_03685 [bacterium]
MYCKTCVAIVIAICVIASIYSLLAQSQEENEKPDPNRDVIFIEHSEGNKNFSEFIIKSGESEPTKVKQKETRDNNNSEKRALRKEMRKKNQDVKVISENTKNADFEKKESEKTKIVRNIPFNAEKTMTPFTGSKQEGQMQPGQQKTTDGKGLQSYIDVIVKKNLFMPLGSGSEAPKPNYALTAVISDTPNKPQPKAIIEQIGANRGFYVSVGDTFADGAKVIEIDEKTAKIERSGEELTLSLGVGTQGGGPRGDFRGQRVEQRQPGSERRAENRQMRSGTASNNFDPNNIPPFVRKMLEDRGISIEELQNNPDLREKLRSEFMQRFRGGGTPPPDVAPVIIEAPSR